MKLIPLKFVKNLSPLIIGFQAKMKACRNVCVRVVYLIVCAPCVHPGN